MEGRMQGEIEPMWGKIEANSRKLRNLETQISFLGGRVVLDLHKSGNELILDLHKSGNELILDLHINDLQSGIIYSLILNQWNNYNTLHWICKIPWPTPSVGLKIHQQLYARNGNYYCGRYLNQCFPITFYIHLSFHVIVSVMTGA